MKKEQKQQVSTEPSNVLYTLLGVVASNQVNELIKQGWEFTLHFGDNRTWCDIIEQPCWEADFTRKKIMDCGIITKVGMVIHLIWLSKGLTII